MLIESEVDGICIRKCECWIRKEVVEHGCPRPLTLLHVNLAGLDEVAVVGLAAGPYAEALLQAVASVLVHLIMAKVGKTGIGHGAGNKKSSLVQVEAGCGGSTGRRRGAGFRDGSCHL